MSERRFKKIKSNGGKVILVYEQKNREGIWDTYTIESTEAPAPSFNNAIQGMREPLLVETELFGLVDPLHITVGGVSISHASGIVGLVISGTRSLKRSGAPLVINSPHKPAEPYSEGGDPDLCLQGETVDALDALITQAELYLEGERAQTDLFKKAS